MIEREPLLPIAPQSMGSGHNKRNDNKTGPDDPIKIVNHIIANNLGPKHDTNGQQRGPQDAAQPTTVEKTYKCGITTTTVKPFIYKARDSSLVPEGFLTAQLLQKL